jgi:HSP20 family protein
MNLVPWRRGGQMDLFQQLQREMDQLMQRYFGETEGGAGRTELVAWVPRIDLEEDDKQFVVKADLPGVDPKDVEVSVVENALVLRGQKTEQREERKKNYHRIERFEGQFYREIPLPPGIDADQIQARSSHGVLTVTIPKKAETQPKKIAVQAES